MIWPVVGVGCVSVLPWGWRRTQSLELKCNGRGRCNALQHKMVLVAFDSSSSWFRVLFDIVFFSIKETSMPWIRTPRSLLGVIPNDPNRNAGGYARQGCSRGKRRLVQPAWLMKCQRILLNFFFVFVFWVEPMTMSCTLDTVYCTKRKRERKKCLLEKGEFQQSSAAGRAFAQPFIMIMERRRRLIAWGLISSLSEYRHARNLVMVYLWVGGTPAGVGDFTPFLRRTVTPCKVEDHPHADTVLYCSAWLHSPCPSDHPCSSRLDKRSREKKNAVEKLL